MANKGLAEEEFDTDPFTQFDRWFREHLQTGVHDAEAAAFGSGFAGGRISVRMILLKDYDENGFVFYTNYNSRKGIQLISNPHGSLLFYWPESARQIRIEGIAEKVSDEESDEYFTSRPRESRISAWASEQSEVIPDRNFLLKKFEHYKDLFSGREVPRPDYWGGFRLIPDWFEFWQQSDFRLHDRLTYSINKDVWVMKRLAP
ncbi:MAG: pyridoxamine 5'-phosphate oxidase [Bacteroidota bacterium]|nr:pyridoxamine 5'-phosphate oxidase [Bacteroidota bacterium]